MTSLVDAPPPHTTEGEKRPVKGERGELRRPEGVGGWRRAAEAGGRGRPEEREGEQTYGEQRGVMREGGRSGAGRGDFFSSLLVGPRITNPIRTSPPG